MSNAGSFVYSNVILIKVENSTKNILVYPNPVGGQLKLNPVGGQLKLNLVADKQSRYNILVTDITGKTVIKVSPPLFERGNNYYTINTSTLSTGTYTLIVSNDETKYVRQFVKH